jgi:hypothetical protein
MIPRTDTCTKLAVIMEDTGLELTLAGNSDSQKSKNTPQKCAGKRSMYALLGIIMIPNSSSIK